MDYIILEYLVCFLAVLGFATMPFFISVILMLAQRGLAYFSRSTRKADSRISQLVVGFGGHALESGRRVSLVTAETAVMAVKTRVATAIYPRGPVRR